MPESLDGDTVGDFYDRFLHSRMLTYRLYGSRRIAAAARMVLPHVQRNSRVVEIGCGIGIATERIARRARRGQVWACDLSSANVWYARKTIRRRNIEFLNCDVLSDSFDNLRTRVREPIDVFVLIDVIEHLRSERLPLLFRRLAEMAAPRAIVALSYPTPAYQLYLQEHNRAELQPIDEVIELSRLMDLAAGAGFVLRQWSAVDIDVTGQYAHCILQSGTQQLEPVPTRMSPFEPLAAFLRKYVLVPMRHRRYVKKPFGDHVEGGI